ncbi:hypothetical protein M2432_004970 [Mycobacterium sp. OTB74]|jgi:hypothetical protein|nr:hypothetical protein [Mycobacterium sp. OTB74]
MTAHTDRDSPRERVWVHSPWDIHNGETGTAHWSYADCSDMIHVVRFPDKATARNHAEELTSIKVQPLEAELAYGLHTHLRHDRQA